MARLGYDAGAVSGLRRFSLLLSSLAVVTVTFAAAAQPIPAGPPFAVSTGNVFPTAAPSLVVGPRGESAFFWIGECPELALCMRGYDADGDPFAPAAAVPTSTLLFEAVPAVALGADGNPVLVWSRPGEGFERRVVGRRFAFDGTPLGAEFTVAAASAQVYDRPSVAVAGDGELVVVFEKLRFDGFVGEGEEQVPIYTGVEILGRRLSAAGAPRGALFRVDGEGADQVASPSVARAPSGGFLAAWESFDLLAGEEDVLARLFTPAMGGGATAVGDEFAVHASGAGVQRAPAAAATTAGGYLVAWEQTLQGQTGVYLQVFDGAGQPGSPFDRRAGSGAAMQAAPAAGGGDGAFVVAWQDERAGGSVWAQRRSAAGQLLDAEFRLDVAAGGRAVDPAVGLYGGPGTDTGLVAGWTLLGDGFERDVFGRRYPGVLPPPEPCVSAPDVLCLGAGDRFEVRAAWATTQATSGTGNREEITADTGYFWFFNPNNLELVVKVLDGCPVNGRFWVFAGGLTNVEVTLTVRDTTDDERAVYANPQSTAFQPIQDTGAFLCP